MIAGCHHRRAVLVGALGLGAVRSFALAQPGGPMPPQHSQAEVAYQPSPKGIAMCASCTLFVRPNLCKVVAGEVSPEGWCRLFDVVD